MKRKCKHGRIKEKTQQQQPMRISALLFFATPRFPVLLLPYTYIYLLKQVGGLLGLAGASGAENDVVVKHNVARALVLRQAIAAPVPCVHVVKQVVVHDRVVQHTQCVNGRHGIA